MTGNTNKDQTTKLDLPSGRVDITLPDWIKLGTAQPRKVDPAPTAQ